jgi:thiopurine S-methyltransferase
MAAALVLWRALPRDAWWSSDSYLAVLRLRLTDGHVRRYFSLAQSRDSIKTMDRDFWLARWQNNQIGRTERAARSPLGDLGRAAGVRIFVPLCGKSHDMHWLRALGFTIFGAELSRLAVEQFFAELGLAPVVAPAGRLERFETEGMTLFVGDIFDLDQDTLCAVDAIYDRAALVALPAPLREHYAAHLIELTRTAPQLLVTFEYDQTRQPGPPFSVLETEVRAHYGATYRLDRVEVSEVQGGLKGVCPAQESVRLINQR